MQGYQLAEQTGANTVIAASTNMITVSRQQDKGRISLHVFAPKRRENRNKPAQMQCVYWYRRV